MQGNWPCKSRLFVAGFHFCPLVWGGYGATCRLECVAAMPFILVLPSSLALKLVCTCLAVSISIIGDKPITLILPWHQARVDLSNSCSASDGESHKSSIQKHCCRSLKCNARVTREIQASAKVNQFNKAAETGPSRRAIRQRIQQSG